MAFVGLLISLKQTSKQFAVQRDESTFFNLLNFHIMKTEKMTYEGTFGYEAFKKLIEFFQKKYKEKCKKMAILEIENNSDKLPEFAYFNFLNDKIYAIKPSWREKGSELASRYFNQEGKNMSY
jgi:hypothetical protein